MLYALPKSFADKINDLYKLVIKLKKKVLL